VDACEPRQIRKEAAAAGCARVAVLSGSVSSLLLLPRSSVICSMTASKNAHVQEHTARFFFVSSKYQASWIATMVV